MHYAAIGPDGTILGVEDSAQEAAALLKEALPDTPVIVHDVGAELAHNPEEDILGSRMPQRALQLSGIRPVSRFAAKMDMREAHQKLLPFFKGLKLRGKEVRSYDTPYDMRTRWIGQNYKTGKEHPEQPSKVMGLSLVPADHALLAAHREGAYRLLRPELGRRFSRQLPAVPRSFSLCVGSTRECRDSCLVFAGQNASEIYNTYRKVAQTLALLSEPEAFCCMLHAAIVAHRDYSRRNDLVPYMRLNVLSDIPWELVAPWLFEIPGVQFYDYTKVAFRARLPRYDLTFSYSGSRGNSILSRKEVHRGSRLAVVFLAHRDRRGQWVAWKGSGSQRKTIPLPDRFWGLRVVDGDVSDVRPLDPAPSIVGLRWKPPSGERSGVSVDPSAPGFAFAVPTHIVNGAAQLVGETTNPTDPEAQWLVSPVTPRFQAIEHDMAQPW